MRYDVVLVGYRLNASVKAAQALQKVLGLDPETCKQLARQFPATVLSAVSQSRAERVAEELTECGGKVEVRESRLSHASDISELAPGAALRPASLAPVQLPAARPANEQSGNYEIGEILAPLKKGSLAPKPPEAPLKRPSREELEDALQDSFRPMGNATPPAEPPRRPFSMPPPGDSLELDGAFAGLQNFDDTFGGTAPDAAPLEVEEKAFRAIQRSPAAAQKPKPKETGWQRFKRKLAALSGDTMDWVMGLFWLAVVSAITAAAVGWALDPHNVLGPLGLGEYNDRARELIERAKPR